MNGATIRIASSRQGEEREKAFEDEVFIGRPKHEHDREIGLDLTPDHAVSRRHARIWVENGHCWIQDLQSTAGTFVDGRDIRGLDRFELKPGVPVRVGQTTLTLVAVQPPPPLALHAEIQCLPTLNYSLVHCDVPFLSGVTLVNDGDTPLENLNLQVVLAEYAKSESLIIPLIPAKGRHAVSSLPRLPFDRLRLRDLAAPEIVRLEMWVNGEQVPLRRPVEVTVLPPNAWHYVGHDAALAGFVMPNCDAVDEIITRSRLELRRLLKGVQGFADALESSDPAAFEKTLKAIYYCLQERYAITYEYEPRTYAPDWQIVRFHHEVLAELEGTCIDLALLFAACLENVHRDPLIIIVEMRPGEQHAVIGCWRQGTPYTSALLRNETQLRQLVDSGEMLVLDSKGFPASKALPTGMGFRQARKAGKLYVDNCRLRYALDVVAAREEKFAPMPFGKGVQYDRTAWLALFRARREAERQHHAAVGARHLLLGLLSLENGLLPQVFARLGEDTATQVAELARSSLKSTAVARRVASPPYTEHLREVLSRAREMAESDRTLLVTEAGLATALLETPSGVDDVLKRLNITAAECLNNLRNLMEIGPVASEWHSSGFAT